MKSSARFVTVALAATLVLLAGCNAPQVFYNRLDLLVGLKLDHYVDLDDRQEADFKQRFNDLWRWHRRNELPAYAGELERIAGVLDGRPIAEADLERLSERSEDLWRQTALRTLASSCPLVQGLDDGQVGEILETLDEDNAEFAEEHVDVPLAKKRKKTRDRTRKWLERWLGDLDDAQEARLERWAAERTDTTHELLAQRKVIRNDLAAAFAKRRTPQGCAALRPLLLGQTPDGRERLEKLRQRNRDETRAFTIDLLASLSAEQRAHARTELKELAGDLRDLARQPV